MEEFGRRLNRVTDFVWLIGISNEGWSDQHGVALRVRLNAEHIMNLVCLQIDGGKGVRLSWIAGNDRVAARATCPSPFLALLRAERIGRSLEGADGD